MGGWILFKDHREHLTPKSNNAFSSKPTPKACWSFSNGDPHQRLRRNRRHAPAHMMARCALKQKQLASLSPSPNELKSGKRAIIVSIVTRVLDCGLGPLRSYLWVVIWTRMCFKMLWYGLGMFLVGHMDNPWFVPHILVSQMGRGRKIRAQ